MGAIVDLGNVHDARERPPEVEDRLFDPSRAERVGYVGGARLWEVAQEGAAETLVEIFGPDLEHHHGARASVAVLGGQASLGVYRPIAGCDLVVRSNDTASSLRIRLPAERLDLSLTDARYFEDEFRQPNFARVRVAQAALESGAEVLLGVGLTRPFAPGDGAEERHWLQVNALHLSTNPGLRLP